MAGWRPRRLELALGLRGLMQAQTFEESSPQLHVPPKHRQCSASYSGGTALQIGLSQGSHTQDLKERQMALAT